MNWLDKLTQDLKPVAEVPPKGFKSVEEIAKHLNRGLDCTRKLMCKAAKDGKARQVQVRVIRADGRRGFAPYYGPISGKDS